MQLIQDLDMTRVAYYQRQMAKGCIPTALALGRMDARNAYKFCIDNGSKALLPMSTVTLQSFLIDGHHKLYAAGINLLPHHDNNTLLPCSYHAG